MKNIREVGHTSIRIQKESFKIMINHQFIKCTNGVGFC